MEESSSEYDFLNFAKDHYIKTNVARDEAIEFSDKVYKYNKFGFKQERNILITNKGIYNLKKKRIKKKNRYKVNKRYNNSKTIR